MLLCYMASKYFKDPTHIENYNIPDLLEYQDQHRRILGTGVLQWSLTTKYLIL
jgi:hypothetical protein